jgi:hypothetical protein
MAEEAPPSIDLHIGNTEAFGPFLDLPRHFERPCSGSGLRVNLHVLHWQQILALADRSAGTEYLEPQ